MKSNHYSAHLLTTKFTVSIISNFLSIVHPQIKHMQKKL